MNRDLPIFLSLIITSIVGLVVYFIYQQFNSGPRFAADEIIHSIDKLTSYKLLDAFTVDNKNYYLKIETEYGKASVEVEQDKCYLFDSVDLKTVGDRYMVRIRENRNCPIEKDFSKFQPSQYSYQGGKLTRNRCFSEAIVYYSKCIEVDSLNSDWYYGRGLNYLFKKNYRAAITDFLHSFSLIDTKQFSKASMDRFLFSKQSMSNKKLIAELKLLFSSSTDLKKLAHLDKVIALRRFADYKQKILFCFEKLNK